MKNRRTSGVCAITFTILFLMFSGSVSAALADDKPKRPKNTGTLSISTTPKALPVKINNRPVGMSGVEVAAEFYLTPGIHRVEIEVPNGRPFIKEVRVVKNSKHCISLDVRTEWRKRCPYDMRVDGHISIDAGEPASYEARDLEMPRSEDGLYYFWSVSPSGANITNGQGTKAITVNTTGYAGKTLTVDVIVTDGVNDKYCRQRVAISTEVDRRTN